MLLKNKVFLLDNITNTVYNYNGVNLNIKDETLKKLLSKNNV